jgi:C_GCAxxG_C_C family probable redox protein
VSISIGHARDPRDVAVEQFNRGYNCAEAMLLALLPPGIAEPQRAGVAFGAGIARRGLTCGCLTGCAVAVGLRLGRTSPNDKESKELVYRVVGNVLRRFEERFGTLECRKLTDMDFNQEYSHEEWELVRTNVCTKLVRFVADATLAELAAAENERSMS